ncbi:MAG TPA: murein biosynthesis integral membrane protein MurJ [Gemmatimonadales bacterium]|nr:murein biosynthesis integral membrane protein MurJ [Gemmatimonadales bacterium]
MPAAADRGSSGRHAALVAAGILVSRILGFIRERVFAHYFGNDTIPADAFRIALRIPNTIRNLLGEGTLSASFIPVYAALNERADKSAARAVAGAVLGLVLLATGVLAVLGIAFAPAITAVIAAGFDEPRRALTVTLVRILFPMTGLMVVSAWCLGILNTHRRFFLPYAAPAMWNVAGIVAMVGGATWYVNHSLPVEAQLHQLALALAWGTVAGSLLQIAVQLPVCWRLLGGIPVRASLVPEGVRDVVRALLPVVVGAGAAQLSGLVDALLSTLTGHGGTSTLGYAQLVQVLPVSLFGASVNAVALPDLSREAVAEGADQLLRTRVAMGFRRIAYFVLPSAVAFIALGTVIAGAIFQTGRFAARDSELVGTVLAAYGVGLLGQASVKLFASGFYALRDTRTPVKIAISCLVLAGVSAFVLLRWLGPAGIALGSSIGWSVSLVFHVRDLNGRIGRILHAPDWRFFGTALGGALAAGGAGWLAARLAAGLAPIPLALVAFAMFGAVYGTVTVLFRHPDALRLWHYLRNSPAR